MNLPADATRVHAPVEGFAVVDGEWAVGGVPLSRLAARVGRTPFYAYDRMLLARRASDLRSVLPKAVKLHYAVKANPMPALVAFLGQRVDGADVASGGELKVALDAGFDPQAVSFAGAGKQASELEQAVAAGVLINVESRREVRLLAELSDRHGWTPRVAVRVNPDFELKGAGMKMGGGAKPFGVDVEQVPALLKEIGAAGLGFEGFHVFAGSQNLRAEAICEAQRHVYELALRLAGDAPAPVRTINLGGGFGIPYFPGDRRLDLAPVGDTLAGLCERASRDFPGASLIVELGRHLVGEAGVYVVRVVDRKVSCGQTFLVADGGLHHHLAASGNFGQVIRRNFPIANARVAEAAAETVNVVGPLCTPLDVLGAGVSISPAVPGDLLVVFQSGAYGASASPQNFLSHPPVAEVLV